MNEEEKNKKKAKKIFLHKKRPYLMGFGSLRAAA